MEEGARLFAAGKLDEAGQVFRGLTRDYPSWADAQNNLAVVLAARGDYDGARQWLEAAVRSEPGYAGAYKNLGDTYTRLAALAYERALQLDEKAVPSAQRAEAETSGQASRSRAPVDTSVVVNEQKERAAVARHIARWASARSRLDLDNYLSAYEPGFSPDQEPRNRWVETLRTAFKTSVRRPVQLENVRINMDGNEALARFRYTEQADSQAKTTEKLLQLRRGPAGQWLIARELDAPRHGRAAPVGTPTGTKSSKGTPAP